MRILYLVAVMACATAGPLGAETLHSVGGHCNTCNGACNGAHNSTCIGGSLEQYPGGCCLNPHAGCCAALWANYCNERKPCWVPGSRHRFFGHGHGCGSDFLRHPCLTGACGGHRHCATGCTTECNGTSECTSAPDCANGATSAAKGNAIVPPVPPSTDEPSAPMPPTPQDAEIDGQDALSPSDEPPAPPQPSTPSARRGLFPFGLNSPSRSRIFSLESSPSAKRTQLTGTRKE